jgi:predicted metalloprotease
MKWEDFRQSENIDDRRGDTGYAGGGGGGMGLPFPIPGAGGGGGGLGIGMVIVLGILGMLFGVDPRILIGGGQILSGGRAPQQQVQPQQQSRRQSGPPSDEVGKFISAVVAMTEDVWKEVLPQQKNIQYVPPTLVIFNRVTNSGCGTAQSAMGPFYCPLDRKVYLDTSFFNDMKRRLGGGGDFAYAYVIAHEIGHHIENLMGILPRVQQAQRAASSKAEANALSVRVELMADCLAGVWASHANRRWQILEPGDVEKAVRTAQAIGDDRLQEQAQGRVVPDSFTHGSAAQRVAWLQQGLKTGSVDSCNTFARR